MAPLCPYVYCNFTWVGQMSIREDQRYPRLSYNSLDQVAGSTTMRSTHGKYSKSSKEPDGSILYDDDDAGLVLRAVIEAGCHRGRLSSRPVVIEAGCHRGWTL
ncbi:hypothetical protein V1522DRAFT_113437 [Lipomyces starkeyi]